MSVFTQNCNCVVGTLTELQALFPNVIFIDSCSLAAALGIAVKTIHNAGDGFPIQPIRIGRRKLFRLLDVAAYLDGQLGIQQKEEALGEPHAQAKVASPPQVKRGRGRPPKIKNMSAGSGVNRL
jgi:hypothetical protein